MYLLLPLNNIKSRLKIGYSSILIRTMMVEEKPAKAKNEEIRLAPTNKPTQGKEEEIKLEPPRLKPNRSVSEEGINREPAPLTDILPYGKTKPWLKDNEGNEPDKPRINAREEDLDNPAPDVKGGNHSDTGGDQHIRPRPGRGISGDRDKKNNLDIVDKEISHRSKVASTEDIQPIPQGRKTRRLINDNEGDEPVMSKPKVDVNKPTRSARGEDLDDIAHKPRRGTVEDLDKEIRYSPKFNAKGEEILHKPKGESIQLPKLEVEESPSITKGESFDRAYKAAAQAVKERLGDDYIEQERTKILMQYKIAMETSVMPLFKENAERIGIHLEETEAMTVRYKEHISKVEEQVKRCQTWRDESKWWGNVIGKGITIIGVLYGLSWIYQMGLHRQLPVLLKGSIGIASDLISEIKLPTLSREMMTQDTLSQEVLKKTGEWLSTPGVTPTQMLVIGSVGGVLMLSLKAFRLLRRIAK